MTAEIDLQRITTEIHEEVRRRRAAGEFPPGLERELDELFERFAPRAMALNDLDDLLDKAEEASFLDSEAPQASNVRGGALVKMAIARGIGWYVRYLAQNGTVFAATATRLLRLLSQRIDGLEEEVFGRPRAVAEVAAAVEDPGIDLSGWLTILTELLAGTRGRVLHADAGDGSLLAALLGAGIDAYGVEPSDRLAVGAARTGLDVRVDSALTHLRQLADGTLGGLVLSGCVDRQPVPDQSELAALAARKLARGGIVAVVGTNPDAWRRAQHPVVADLAPGRPLQPDTWLHLLQARGLEPDGPARWAPFQPALQPLPAGADHADILNTNLARIGELLFGPPSFVVAARRP